MNRIDFEIGVELEEHAATLTQGGNGYSMEPVGFFY